MPKIVAAMTPNDMADQKRKNQSLMSPDLGLTESGFSKVVNQSINQSQSDESINSVVSAVSNDIDAQKAQADTNQRIAEGSKEVIGEQLDAGNYIDHNPNNRPDSESERDGLLSRILGNPSSSYADILTAIEDDKNREREGQNEIKSLINKYEKAPVGLNLSAFAALLDDPNQAKMLSQSAGMSPEDRMKLIDGLKLKLADRKDKFRESRRNLLTSLMKARDSEAESAAQNKYKIEKDKASTITDRVDNFRKSVVQEEIQGIKQVGPVLKDLVDNGVTAQNAAVLRTIVARSLAQEKGALSTFDVVSVSEAQDVLNKIKSFVNKKFTGVFFTAKDIMSIADMLSSSVRFSAEEIDKKADGEAKTFVKTYGKLFPVTMESLRNSEDGEFRTEQFVSRQTLDNARKFVEQARSKVGAEPQAKEDQKEVESAAENVDDIKGALEYLKGL